jgi:hypothetical protein
VDRSILPHQITIKTPNRLNHYPPKNIPIQDLSIHLKNQTILIRDHLVPKQIANILKYDHRNVSRAIKVLVKAGELGIAIVEAHVKLVAKLIESVAEVVSNLGLINTPTRPAPAPPVSIPVVKTVLEPVIAPPTAPQPPQSQPTRTTPRSNSGAASIGNVIANMGFPQPIATPVTDTDSAVKTPQWYDRVEFRLNAMNIKLADVLHALKKYSVQAIEDAISYTQKQNWSDAKAGVFVNYLKKWTPMTGTVKGKSKSASDPVKTALMEKFPDIATTLAQEQNPIDEATLDYLQRLKVAGGIYDMQYSSIHNFFGVFITVKDYPHLIPWWDAVPQLQQLYPCF